MRGDGPAHDAVLLLSFGGPEEPDDVLPFLENVTRGRNIPRERLREVGEHYFLFGGVSPINAICRELRTALSAELRAQGPRLPVYWGNRNWHPFLGDTLRRMAADGVRRAVAVATSAYSSYSACRQYLDDIERARAEVGAGAPVVEKVPPFWNHPSFIETTAEHAKAALAELDGSLDATHARHEPGARDAAGAGPAAERTRLVFTAHSIPLAMAATCDYEAELREASALVAERAAPSLGWELAYQSRSGPPTQPWLEPDVCDRLRLLREDGVERVVLVPIGFVADHMEVKYDLDVQARAVADEIGLRTTRTATVGTDPRFVAGLRDMIAAHVEGRPRAALGTRGPRPFPCAPGCCAYVPSGRAAP